MDGGYRVRVDPIDYVASYGGKAPGTGNRWSYQAENVDRRVVIVHTSEQAEDVNQADDADQLMRALARAGTAGCPQCYGAGYHAVTDILPVGYHQIAPWHARTNSVPPLNSRGLHVCIPERVAYTKGQWLSSGHLQVAAKFLRDAHDTYGIPFVRLTAADMRGHLDSQGHYNGPKGYCGHHDVSLAFGQSTHTDPDPNFPWDVFHALAVPPPDPIPIPPITGDEEMTPEIWSTAKRNRNLFVVSVVPPVSFAFRDVPTLDRITAAGFPLRSNITDSLMDVVDGKAVVGVI